MTLCPLDRAVSSIASLSAIALIRGGTVSHLRKQKICAPNRLDAPLVTPHSLEQLRHHPVIMVVKLASPLESIASSGPYIITMLYPAMFSARPRLFSLQWPPSKRLSLLTGQCVFLPSRNSAGSQRTGTFRWQPYAVASVQEDPLPWSRECLNTTSSGLLSQ